MELLLLFVVSISFGAIFASVLQSIDVQVAANISVVTTTETIAATGVPTAVETPTCKVAVRAYVLLTVGTNTTAVTLTIYRGTAIGGTVIGTQTAQAGNFSTGNTASFQVEGTDPLTNAGQAQYCVSVKQTGASANGTIVNASIETKVLSG